ncbi:ABC transporter permease [Megasphaera cerevisiae]|uniref:ABC transporter permease n=1 Tax=Megasphaera cerevisiae TaxID=39029 RepID=UPI0009426DA8|nr:ABC transporter permease [Megasphaera cerevisiae]OKY53170.1 peptide ABC transporter permease [Megasphaera cerevisiae]
MEPLTSFRLAGPGDRRETKRAAAPSLWHHVWRDYPVVSMGLLLLICTGCAAAPCIANHDPAQFYLQHLNEAPNSSFYFGTDGLGRDIFSIIWYGGRVSLAVGFLSMIVSACIGIVYGCLSGTASPLVDTVMMRAAELISSIPSILLLLLLLAFIPAPDIFTISLIIGATTWMNLARIVRSEVRQIRNSDYVLASRTMGGGFFHVVWYHLLPNFLSPVMFMIVSSIGSGMMMEATLSFLGIGLPVEIVSWGTMLSLSSRALLTNSWWIILIPGLFLVVTLVCMTCIGHYLRHEVNRGCSNL